MLIFLEILAADYLDCYDGYIGGWRINRNSLYAGDTYLHSSGIIETNYLDIYQTNGTYLGTVGHVAGQDDYGVTHNIGIETTSGERSIILQSARNIALRADGAGIWITGATIHMNGEVRGISAEDISGLTSYIRDVVEPMIPSGGGT